MAARQGHLVLAGASSPARRRGETREALPCAASCPFQSTREARARQVCFEASMARVTQGPSSTRATQGQGATPCQSPRAAGQGATPCQSPRAAGQGATPCQSPRAAGQGATPCRRSHHDGPPVSSGSAQRREEHQPRPGSRRQPRPAQEMPSKRGLRVARRPSRCA